MSNVSSLLPFNFQLKFIFCFRSAIRGSTNYKSLIISVRRIRLILLPIFKGKTSGKSCKRLFLSNLQTLCPLRSIWMLLSIPFTKAYSGRVFMIHFLSFFLLPSFLLSTQAFDRGSSSTAMVWMVVSEEVYFPVGRSALFLGGLLPQLSTEKALNWGPNLQRFFVAKRAKRTL